MSNSNKLSGFNYQTSESTLLGAVENLRMPGMDNLPDYMETFSGVGSMYPTQADLPTFDDNTPSSESDDDSNEQDDADDSSDEQDEVGGLDIFDDGNEDDDMAAGFYGFGQFDGLSADFFDPSARFSGFGASPPAAGTGDFAKIKDAMEAYIKSSGGRDTWTLVSVNKFNDFRGFARGLGNRVPNAKINADITRSENGRTGNTTTDLRVPVDVALKYRDSVPNTPPEEYFQVVIARGQAMTNQEIEAELAQKKKQAGLTQAANKAPAQSKQRGAAPRGDAGPMNLELSKAVSKNATASKKYGWRVDQSKYSAGASDPQLALDAIIFQKFAKLKPPFDGIIGKGTMGAILTLQKAIVEKGTTAQLDPTIMKFVYAVEVPGSPSLRSRAFAPDTAKKAAVVEKAKISGKTVASGGGTSRGSSGGGGGGGGGGVIPPAPLPPVPPAPPETKKASVTPLVLGGVLVAAVGAFFAFRGGPAKD
jgi:uncharacterized membrane protein YgcG